MKLFLPRLPRLAEPSSGEGMAYNFSHPYVLLLTRTNRIKEYVPATKCASPEVRSIGVQAVYTDSAIANISSCTVMITKTPRVSVPTESEVDIEVVENGDVVATVKLTTKAHISASNRSIEERIGYDLLNAHPSFGEVRHHPLFDKYLVELADELLEKATQ